MSARRFRSLGVDPATGKEAFVAASPGGVLEELAEPGRHYKPETYCHPKDAAWEKQLDERWASRCQDLAGESAYSAEPPCIDAVTAA